jgi:hypothetical protein
MADHGNFLAELLLTTGAHIMDLKQKLIDMAREATGDPEIQVAGDFQPKGMTWKVAAGAAAGSVLGSSVDAGGLGAAGGAIAGRYAASSGSLPPVIVMAASPERLYLMTTNNAKGIILAKGLVLLDTIDRANVSVELKQKVTVRTVVITDESTGHEYAMEGKRIIFHHMNDVLNLLAGVDEDEDEDEDELATAEVPGVEGAPAP